MNFDNGNIISDVPSFLLQCFLKNLKNIVSLYFYFTIMSSTFLLRIEIKRKRSTGKCFNKNLLVVQNIIKILSIVYVYFKRCEKADTSFLTRTYLWLLAMYNRIDSESHWLLCIAKNCDWSRKIMPW